MKHIIALLLFASVANAQVTKNVDEFTGAVSFAGSPFVITNTGSHTSRGLAVNTHRQTYILLHIEARTWVHLKHDKADAIHGPDGVIYPMDMIKVDSDVVSGHRSVRTFETIGLTINQHDIRHPLKVRIGGIIYFIPEEMLAEIRQIGEEAK